MDVESKSLVKNNDNRSKNSRSSNEDITLTDKASLSTSVSAAKSTPVLSELKKEDNEEVSLILKN